VKEEEGRERIGGTNMGIGRAVREKKYEKKQGMKGMEERDYFASHL
jgi:adenylosuccinate synthase